MYPARSLIAELEDAIQSGSKDKRVETLRRVTDLFVTGADRFNDEQIEVFDDVLGQLIKRIEARALAELSNRLAPISNAPLETVKRLAKDGDIAVAKSMLTKSPRLSDQDLIEVALTKTQAHLVAISTRPQITTLVTDVLLQRGNDLVVHKLAENPGAHFSESGFAVLVKRAESDEHLAEKVGLRLDIPLRLFRELLLRATEAVRSRLLASADLESRDRIQRVLAAINEDSNRKAGILHEHDFAKAQARVSAMQSKGKLDDAAFFELAKSGRYAEMVAALALLSGASITLIEKLLQSEYLGAYLIPCRASRLAWPTVRLILTCRTVGRKTSADDLEQAQVDYIKLSNSSAERILRFWQVRQTTSHEAAAVARAQ